MGRQVGLADSEVQGNLRRALCKAVQFPIKNEDQAVTFDRSGHVGFGEALRAVGCLCALLVVMSVGSLWLMAGAATAVQPAFVPVPGSPFAAVGAAVPGATAVAFSPSGRLLATTWARAGLPARAPPR